MADTLGYDEGNLCVWNTSVLNGERLTDETGRDAYVFEQATKNIQHLVEKLAVLPVVKKGSVSCVALPPPSFEIPRSLPLPQPKPPTRWEAFAKEKGIKKRKRERMSWDESHNEWRPIHGYKRANDENEDAVIEHKEGMVDPFGERAVAKKERVAKNQSREQRNIVEKEAGKRLSPLELRKKLKQVDHSSASLGQFNPDLPPAKKAKKSSKSKSLKHSKSGKGRLNRKRK